MVSEITTVRLWSQQTALKAFKEVSDENASSGTSSGSSLADILYSDGSDDEADDDTSLSRLIASLQQQAMAGDVPAEENSDGAVEDIESRAFMKALAAKLEELKAGSGTGAMAEAMQEALEAGTLTVTDAVAGEAISAWSPEDADGAAGERTAVATTDWTSFLKQHLAREGGLYVRNADSSHQDRLTGENAYFGMIGDTYYYLSWAEAEDEAAAPPPSAPAG